MDADTLFHESYREGGRVGAFFVAAIDGVVGHEPVVSTASFVFASSMAPSFYVRFVSIRNTCGAALERNGSFLGEMKNVFVAVVDVALAIDRFEMASADGIA